MRRRDREQQQLEAVVCAPGVQSRLPELFCQATNHPAPQHRDPHVKLAEQVPHEAAHLHAIMGGGPKVPYALPLNVSPDARLTCTGTQSTSGRRPEVGMPNPPTGKPTPPSWGSSSAASSEWPGWSAQTESTAIRCPSRVDSSQADSRNHPERLWTDGS